MTIAAGVYDRTKSEQSPAGAGLVIALAAGGLMTVAFLAKHADQRYFAGASQVVGGGINQFDLHSVPGGPRQAGLRVEAIPGGSLNVSCAEFPELSGVYGRM